MTLCHSIMALGLCKHLRSESLEDYSSVYNYSATAFEGDVVGK